MIQFNPFTGTLDFVGNGSSIPTEFGTLQIGIENTTAGILTMMPNVLSGEHAEIRFIESVAGGDYIALRAPNSVSGNKTITLPNETGTLITVTGVNNLFASPPTIGSTLPGNGIFVDLSASGQASFTKSSATGAINISPVWNNGATNFAAIYSRVTNTASGSSSNLIDVGTVAAGSLFKVTKAGIIESGAAPEIAVYTIPGSNQHGLGAASGGCGLYSNGVKVLQALSFSTGVTVSDNVAFGWRSGDVLLTRVAAGVLSLSTGRLRLPNLPTSAAGLSAGDLWNSAGIVMIA